MRSEATADLAQMASDQASHPENNSQQLWSEVPAATAEAQGRQKYTVLVSDDQDPEKRTRMFHCALCDKSYERLDHIKRHITSHENARSFKCDLCPRQFNRRDLLVRHQVGHDDANRDPGDKRKRADRVIQACQACTTAKTKCDDRRPCRRCEKRQMPCVDGETSRRGTLRSTTALLESLTANATTTNPKPDALPVRSDAITSAGIAADEVSARHDTNIPLSNIFQTQAPLSNHPNHPDQQEILPVLRDNQQGGLELDPWWDNMDWQSLSLHADLGHIYQDVDFQFDNELPSIAGESWPDIDTPREAGQGNGVNVNPTPAVAEGLAPYSQTRPYVSGHEAFKKSPWLWTPSRQDHAYSSQGQLAVNETHIMASPEIADHNSSSTIALPKLSGSGARDEMLSMLVKFSKSTFKIRSFPSHNLLDVLMQALLVRDNSSPDSCIHLATFNPDVCRTELLAGLVAAGSTCFAISNIWRMGLALQEIVRLAICDSLDTDNRLARDLETNQTFLIWTELGLWSGFRRKMEVAEGFASTLPTMLRRAGAFKQSYYSKSSVPAPVDEGTALQQKWYQWIESESYRRLVFRVFINEIRASIAFVRKPLLSGVELTLTMPASKDLWEARTAEEWKDLYLSKTVRVSNLTLMDVLRSPSSLEGDREILDLPLAAHAALYAVWDDVWSLADSKIRHQDASPASTRATTQLWLQARHQELYGSLKSLRENLEKMSAFSPETDLLCELSMMFLHSSAADIQSFAGRFGEEEVKRTLPKLREWATKGDMFIATWHAGQVLRAARRLPPTSLRGFLAIAVYHASLLLWIATWLSRKSSAPSRSSPAPEGEVRVVFDVLDAWIQEDLQAPSDWVVLDGPETAQVRKYITSRVGRAALQLNSKVASLANPTTISATMMEIFRQNYPSKDHPLPPLLENLSSLMEELNQTR